MAQALRRERAGLTGGVTVGDLFSGPGGKALAAQLAIPFLGAVPFDPRLASAADQGVPFVAAEPESPASRALLQIAGRLLSSFH